MAVTNFFLEIKRAAQENSPNLKEMLRSIRIPEDVTPTCFEEALLEASRAGHMNAICWLVFRGGKQPLQLKYCMTEALRFHLYEAAAMLLTCYAAKRDKRRLLKYLMSVEMSREDKEGAFSELPHDGVPNDAVERMRYGRS